MLLVMSCWYYNSSLYRVEQGKEMAWILRNDWILLLLAQSFLQHSSPFTAHPIQTIAQYSFIRILHCMQAFINRLHFHIPALGLSSQPEANRSHDSSFLHHLNKSARCLPIGIATPSLPYASASVMRIRFSPDVACSGTVSSTCLGWIMMKVCWLW